MCDEKRQIIQKMSGHLGLKVGMGMNANGGKVSSRSEENILGLDCRTLLIY